MALALAITAAALGVVAAANSVALGSVSAVSQHNQAKANAQMQADQMNYNKRLEEREAAQVEAEAAENARRQREESERLKSMQRAMLGKSGAAMTSGSPLAILGDTAADEELKTQDVHAFGYQAASRHTASANMFGYQARVAKAQAPSGTSLGLNIAGQFSSGVGNMANSGMGLAGFLKK